MNTTPSPEFHDQAALRAVHLIETLDSMIRALRGMLSPKQPWQRKLLIHLDAAYQQMQILRMTESLSRPDEEIGEAASKLSLSCRQLKNAVQGSRADGLTRNAVGLVAQGGQELATLMKKEILNPPDESA